MDGVTGGWTDSSYDRRAVMTDGLSVGWTDSATALWGDRQTVGAVGMTDGGVARQTVVLKDGWVMQQTYRRSGGGGGGGGGGGEGARWGCKATYSLLMVGGPLDRCRRGLGSVESRRCNWAARKSRLGVSRRSYRPGYTP